ncbi:MAG: CHAD domain-containing protein [Solirubrobacteraceae bacterium]
MAAILPDSAVAIAPGDETLVVTMADDGDARYLLPDGAPVSDVVARLGTHLGAVPGRAAASERTFYDTFDGRLHARGLILVHEDGELRLTGRGRSVAAPVGERPERLGAAGLPAGPLRDALAPVVEVRALVPTATIRIRSRPLLVLDDEGKTVVRLAAETVSLLAGGRARRVLAPRLEVHGVRGYDSARARACAAVEGELGLQPAALTLQEEAVIAAGGRPEGTSLPLSDLALDARDRADAAAATVLAHLLATIELNLPGTLADVDPEFLHDFRVAVRRTRSVQRQLQRVFPPEPLAAARRDFRWLQQITGPSRDLDVGLLDFDAIAARLPAAHAAELEPLRGVLAERRTRERARMVRTLRGARARRVLAGWSALVGGLADAPEDDRPDAARPIADVAGERILRVHRQMVRLGSAIDDDSPPTALHDLRKRGKELRYLLELFGSAFPAEHTRPLVKSLKALQDTLGRFQDREVQAGLFAELAEEAAGREGGHAALLAAGMLIGELGHEQVEARAEFADRFAAFAAKRRRRAVREAFG